MNTKDREAERAADKAGTSFAQWLLLGLAAINGLSGIIDDHHPEHYIAGSVFLTGYVLLSALRDHLRGEQ